MEYTFISLTTDFAVQNLGIGAMKGVIFEINPKARIIDLMHGIPDYDTKYAARAMEATINLPVGIHVCVVDPGVGTSRREMMIRTRRGDILVGPDNGVLISAIQFLGGFDKAVHITNPKYMNHPVSPIFHGRDIFAAAAAHLSRGVPMEEFGPTIALSSMVRAPYDECQINEETMTCEVISINKFGSVHVNILATSWAEFEVEKFQKVTIHTPSRSLNAVYANTFGDVEIGKPVLLRDEYRRMQLSVNQGSFADRYNINNEDTLVIKKDLRVPKRPVLP